MKARKVGRMLCLVLAVFAPIAAIALLRNASGQSTGSDASAQPSFEVAAIKPNDSADARMNFRLAPGRFSVEHATVEQLIRFSYDLRTEGALEKGPKWTNSERFDIDAKISDTDVAAMQKIPPTQRFQQFRLMMRTLLVERFGLKIETTMKDQSVYALMVAKSGPTLMPLDAKEQHMPTLWGGSTRELHAGSVTMAFFCDWLSGNADAGGRDIVDKTGLTGSYDFTLKWTPIEAGAMATGGTAANEGVAGTAGTDEGGVSLFTALQEQLGLKLVPQRAPVEVLVIDHVEQPSQN